MLFTDDNYLSDVERVLEKTPDWTKVTNKSVFITGASGMIGTFLIDVLMYQNKTRNANISIWAMGRTLSRLEERFTSYLEDPLFHIVIGDVTEEIQIAEACDYVLHCASNTSKSYASDPIGTIMTNIAGTQHILDYAVKANSEKCYFYQLLKSMEKIVEILINLRKTIAAILTVTRYGPVIPKEKEQVNHYVKPIFRNMVLMLLFQELVVLSGLRCYFRIVKLLLNLL